VLVRARDLTIGYADENPVCAPLTFTVRAGDVVAVVGANGTGKSTLLRCVLGLLDPLDGSLDVLGSGVDERTVEHRRAVAGVLDDDAYFPALTVAEHLTLTARGHGVADAVALVESVLDEFGLAGHAEHLPTALSSGQRRRLLLAAAFVRPRRLLVLDEPEQRLDAGMRDRLVERLVAERRSGGAAIVASHDPGLVRRAATRAVVVGDEASTEVTPEQGAAAIEAL
jgi:ABC-type multidrug transport system ATPase subunit